MMASAGRPGRPGDASAGFSLIEVLLVLVIIGILAAIAIPMYLGHRDRAKNAAARVGGRHIAIALLSYVTESDADDPWPSHCDPATLSTYIDAEQWPVNPFGDGALMQTVTAPSLGDYLYEREPGGGWPARPYHLSVFLHDQPSFVVP